MSLKSRRKEKVCGVGNLVGEVVDGSDEWEGVLQRIILYLCERASDVCLVL